MSRVKMPTVYRVAGSCLLLIATGLWPEGRVLAQAPDRCAFLCAPAFKVEPTITVENLVGAARVETVGEGGVIRTDRQARDQILEVVLATVIPTEIPRIDFTVETILGPIGDDPGLELELEANFTWLESDQTKGWVESHIDLVDKFSPAERPSDRAAYTHKLNIELDTAVLVFNWLKGDSWLKNVELEGSLDYVATGLPRAGDVVGNQRFLDDASPWSFSLVFVFPFAPLVAP